MCAINYGTPNCSLHHTPISFLCRVLLDLPTKNLSHPSSSFLSFHHGPYHCLSTSGFPYDLTSYFCSSLPSPSPSNANHIISLLRASGASNLSSLAAVSLMLMLVQCYVPRAVIDTGDTKKEQSRTPSLKEITVFWRMKSTSNSCHPPLFASHSCHGISNSHSLLSSCLCLSLLCLKISSSFFNPQLICYLGDEILLDSLNRICSVCVPRVLCISL